MLHSSRRSDEKRPCETLLYYTLNTARIPLVLGGEIASERIPLFSFFTGRIFRPREAHLIHISFEISALFVLSSDKFNNVEKTWNVIMLCVLDVTVDVMSNLYDDLILCEFIKFVCWSYAKRLSNNY